MVWRFLSLLGLTLLLWQGWSILRDHEELLVYVSDATKTAWAVELAADDIANSGDLPGRIDELIESGDLSTAQSYVDLAAEAGVVLPESLLQRLMDAQSPWRRLPVLAGGWLKGFIFGDSADVAELAGAVSSDLLVIGDLRDLGEAGLAFGRGEDVDETVVALSAIGVALSAGTIVSAGSVGPAKFGAATVKRLLRSGRITAGLAGELRVLARTALPPERLRRIFDDTLSYRPFVDRTGMVEQIAASVNRHAEPQAMAALLSAKRQMVALVDVAGSTGLFRLSRHADDLADLRRLSDVAPLAGKRTLALEHALGKGILSLAKTSLKWSLQLWLALAGLVSGLLSLMAGLFGNWAWRRLAKGYFFRFVQI